MWLDDLAKAIAFLFEEYSYSCTVERIHDNVIRMSNRDVWVIRQGKLEFVGKGE